MTGPSARRRAPGSERLSNWLALLALLALGIVWPGAEAARLPPTSQVWAASLTRAAPQDVAMPGTP